MNDHTIRDARFAHGWPSISATSQPNARRGPRHLNGAGSAFFPEIVEKVGDFPCCGHQPIAASSE
jgi:hypothetical protein